MIRRIALPALALAVAGLLVVLATGVFDVAASLRAGRRTTSHAPQASVAQRLLGVSSQLAFREALRLVRMRGGTLSAQLHRRERAEEILSRLADRGNSRAANLLGLLDLQDALLNTDRSQQALTQAQSAFESAIRSDPRNADAKYNLELLLALRSKHRAKAEPRTGAARKGPGGYRPGGSGY